MPFLRVLIPKISDSSRLRLSILHADLLKESKYAEADFFETLNRLLHKEFEGLTFIHHSPKENEKANTKF